MTAADQQPGNSVSNVVRACVVVGWVAALLIWETKRALRRNRDSKLVRDVRNLAIAAPAGAIMQFAETPLAIAVASWSAANGWGALNRVSGATALKVTVAVVLLDYTLYLWHVLTHKVPFLWRFHRVHHVDREMDATTALRFHFGEITLSLAFRAGQMLVIGPPVAAVGIWQLFLFVCILFHHSNVRLPIGVERTLMKLVVTPRLHGIHHSIEAEFLNSNWSSGLTVWDWLHRTLRTDAAQDSLVLGVAGCRSDEDQELLRNLAAPFRD